MRVWDTTSRQVRCWRPETTRSPSLSSVVVLIDMRRPPPVVSFLVVQQRRALLPILSRTLLVCQLLQTFSGHSSAIRSVLLVPQHVGEQCTHAHAAALTDGPLNRLL